MKQQSFEAKHKDDWQALEEILESDSGTPDNRFELTGQYTHIINQHKAILTGIKSGSEDEAKAAMEAHMRDVFNILRIAPEKYPEYFE